MFGELSALWVADIIQMFALIAAVGFQAFMLRGIVTRRINWQYTILPGGFLLHVTIFYIADAFRVHPVPSVFFLFWSSLLRFHGIVVVIIMSWIVFEFRKQWIHQSP